MNPWLSAGFRADELEAAANQPATIPPCGDFVFADRRTSVAVVV
jgi:hypothetical protein